MKNKHIKCYCRPCAVERFYLYVVNIVFLMFLFSGLGGWASSQSGEYFRSEGEIAGMFLAIGASILVAYVFSRFKDRATKH